MKVSAEITKPIEYKGYVVEPWYGRFVPLSDRASAVASFIVHKENFTSVFAFSISLLSAMTKQLSDEELLNKTQEIIKSYIDGGKMENLKEFTFEFESEEFVEVDNQTWWIKSGSKDPLDEVLSDERFSAKPKDTKFNRYLSVLVIPISKKKTLIPSTPKNDSIIRNIVVNEANLLDPKPDVDGTVSTIASSDGESHFRSTDSGVIFLRHSLREPKDQVFVRTLLSTTFKALKITHFIYEHFKLKFPIYIKFRITGIEGNILETGSSRRSLSTEDKASSRDNIDINEGPILLDTAKVSELTIRIVLLALRGFGNNRLTEETLKDFLGNIAAGVE